MTTLQERLRENCVGQPATIEWPHRILHEAANALDAAEAEIARLKEALGKCGANFTICTNTSDPKDDYERALREISKRQIIAHEALAARTQPPAVGEDVVRALDLMTEARSRLNGIACGFWSEDQTELSTAMAAEAGIAIDYIDEVASILRTKDAG